MLLIYDDIVFLKRERRKNEIGKRMFSLMEEKQRAALDRMASPWCVRSENSRAPLYVYSFAKKI